MRMHVLFYWKFNLILSNPADARQIPNRLSIFFLLNEFLAHACGGGLEGPGGPTTVRPATPAVTTPPPLNAQTVAPVAGMQMFLNV